jgi:hypothetical protein
MQQGRIAILFLVTVAAGYGCGPKTTSSSNSPNVVEQVADDVETEVDQADETAETVGEDVSEAAEDVVEEVGG